MKQPDFYLICFRASLFQFVIHLSTRHLHLSCVHPHKLSSHWMVDIKMRSDRCICFQWLKCLGGGGWSGDSSIIVTVRSLRVSRPQTMLLIDLSPKRGEKKEIHGKLTSKVMGYLHSAPGLTLSNFKNRKLKAWSSDFVLYGSWSRGALFARCFRAVDSGNWYVHIGKRFYSYYSRQMFLFLINKVGINSWNTCS